MRSEHCPDLWSVVRITGSELDRFYKIFGCWYGGYGGSDSWRINSGIVKVTLDVDRLYYDFRGSSGSVYRCHTLSYGISGYGTGILQSMIDRANERNMIMEILTSDTDWLTLDYKLT